jgi:hypothetical protein
MNSVHTKTFISSSVVYIEVELSFENEKGEEKRTQRVPILENQIPVTEQKQTILVAQMSKSVAPPISIKFLWSMAHMSVAFRGVQPGWPMCGEKDRSAN